MTGLNDAAASGDRITILIALRDALISGMSEATPGVLPQFAKQIADLTREIDELRPKDEEVTDVDGFTDAFASAVETPEPKRKTRK